MKPHPTLEELNKIMEKNGGHLDLRDTGITDTTNVKRLHNGDYVEGRYLYADNILTHVKSARKKGRYTLYIGKVKGRNVIYDGVNYAHCDKWRDGIADLSFKAAKDRGSEQYRNLTADSVIKKDDAIAMYRVITGACQQGTQRFLDSLPELKEEYTVGEIIGLTKGQYGYETFVRFFGE